MPPSPSLLAPRDPSIASRWKGSSRMKSKKGKAWRAMPAVGAGPGETCSPGPAGLGARVTWWTFQPGTLQAGTAAVLFVEAASEMAVAVFLLDTTRGAVVGRPASPRCWHVVKKHAQRLVCAPPSFIVSADTPRSAEPPRGFSLVLAGGCVGPGRGDPRPDSPGRDRGAAAPLSESWAPGPPTPSQLGQGTHCAGDGVFSQSRECDCGPQTALGCR